MDVAREFIAGCFAGCAGVVVAQPMDTVKVRMQVLNMGTKQGAGNSFSCFFNIMKHERVFGLFKGMVPPLAAVALQNAVLFGVYGNVLTMLSAKEDQKPSLSHVCVAGAASGAAQLWVICPMELIKIKLQMQTEVRRTTSSRYRGATDCIRKIYTTHGIRGLFQGMTPLLFRDIPGFVMYFGSYEILLDLLSQKRSRAEVGPLATVFAGGFAGMISWASTFPFDVIKSRMQADGNSGNFLYKGAVDCFVQNYKTSGLRGLFSGLGPTLLRAFPTNAVIFYVYSLVSDLFKECPLTLTTDMD